MKKLKDLSESNQNALIGAGGAIIVAIITGIFLLWSTLLSNSAHNPIPTPTISSVNPSPTPTVSSASPSPSSSSSSTPNISIAPYGGKLVLDDTLADNSSHGWEVYSDSQHGNACWFNGGVYHASQAKPSSYNFNYCKARQTDFHKFAFQVQMNIVKGDCGGILIDGDEGNVTDPHYFYHFVVCQDGQYYFIDTLSTGYPLAQGNSPDINAGLHQLNFIAIVANPDNGEFDLYVNGRKIKTVLDKRYTQGFIGVGAFDLHNYTTEVTYRDARVWSL